MCVYIYIYIHIYIILNNAIVAACHFIKHTAKAWFQITQEYFIFIKLVTVRVLRSYWAPNETVMDKISNVFESYKLGSDLLYTYIIIYVSLYI
jgi:hypothetical protein